MKNNLRYVRKSSFLECAESTYENESTDYLITLRDSLNILIKQRQEGGCKPWSNYKGYVAI